MRKIIFLATAILLLIPLKGLNRVSLKGSKSSQALQNKEANREKLTRIPNSKKLRLFRRNGLLVPLPQNKTLEIDPRIKPEYRFCRPWTRKFLLDAGQDHYKKFGTPLVVTSAVRPIDKQIRERRKNLNAAPIRGPHASSHLTGSTVDITKRGMRWNEINWLRHYLLTRESAGVIEATEEHTQPVFHIMVFKNYPRRIFYNNKKHST